MTTAPRIAIYARYSSDLQRPSSIADQIALCRSLITRQFGEAAVVVAVYEDAAQTGATMARGGLAAMLKDAEAGRFSIIVAEGLDRISRSLADIASIHRMCQHYGVSLFTSHEGEVTDLHIGFKGTMNALFLRDLKDKIRRSHKAIAAAGRAAGGLAYGYRVVRGVTDDRGGYVNGLREIDPDQAAVIRRIYEEVAAGIPVSEIVRQLNEEGVPAPGGERWRIHSIRGERSRGRGILANEIYRGWLIHNRTRKVVDPKTGRVRYANNPESEWVRTHVPELQIISDELWHRVQAERNPKWKWEKPPSERRRKFAEDRKGLPHPLTGLVKCGACGGHKVVANATRYVCQTYRIHRTCTNARGRREQEVAAAVFQALLDHVAAVEDWAVPIGAKLAAEYAARAQLDDEVASIDAAMARLLTAIENGVQAEQATTRILALQDRLAAIRAMPRLPDLLPSEDIRALLVSALVRMETNFSVPRYADPIAKALGLVVGEVVLTPIPGKARGETMDVRLNTEGWGDFYIQIQDAWPGVAV